MTVMEYGQHNSQVILLLHGGGLSWWNYREAARLLGKRYHVVLPVLDGHPGSSRPFTSIQDNAARLISEIDARWGGRVLAMGGLSLGGQIAVEMLSQRRDICQYALIESASVKPDTLTAALIGPAFGMSYGLIRRIWFARLQARYLGIPPALFDDYFRDTCRISRPDMIAFLRSSSLYSLPPGLAETTANVKILAGSREQKRVRTSGKQLHAAIPGSTMELLPGLRHGDLSLNKPGRYAEILMDWIEEEPQ